MLSLTYTATIIDATTGETRTTAPISVPLDIDALQCMWGDDGSWGCDCNRSLEFARSGGATEDEAWAFGEAAAPGNVCPGRRRFAVPHLTLSDGQRLAIDEEA